MNLTREQAIAEHRKMWNWIADIIEGLKIVVDIADYKKEYCTVHKFYYVVNWCFLCDFTNKNCDKCPLDWGKNDFLGIPCEGESWEENKEKFGLWWKCMNAKTWQEQVALARQIANLPERTDV